MAQIAIIGTQWGDEGKGKITDTLSNDADYVIRYQGGNNAGHTIIANGVKTVLHLIPSGILHQKCKSIIAHGVVFDPDAFLSERDDLVMAGVEITPERLMISSNATVITSYNKLIDALREGQGPVKIGTTGKGIGPAYEDKVSRKAIKVSDLFDRELLLSKLSNNLSEKKVLFESLYHSNYPSLDEEVERLFELGKVIAPFVGDTFLEIERAASEGRKVIYEGAQGALLDIDYGTYPYVTSSNTTSGGVYTGAGSKGLERIIGITKAYTTRVGEGPFPTELFDDFGSYMQRVGGEIGATTGRTRRCGWPDLPLLKYSVMASKVTEIALTKVDVLAGMKELKVCTGYRLGERTIDCAYPGIDLQNVTPIFKAIKPISKEFLVDGEMGDCLKEYISIIEKFVGVPVSMVAYGPSREQILYLN